MRNVILVFVVSAVVMTLGHSMATAQTAPRLKYAWKPGVQHDYEFKVEVESDGTKVTTSGNVSYQLKGANVTYDFDGDTIGADEEGEATSTAFIVTSDGYLLTCAHCVKGAKTITCTIGDKKLNAKLIDINHDQDLAIIKVNGSGLPTVSLAKNRTVQLAQDIRAIGYPLSDVLGDSVKVTRGSVAGLIDKDRGKSIQVDAAVNSGNSGGPLVDDTGAAVGVVSAKLTGMTISKVGFAVPIQQACAMLERNKIKYRVSEGGNVLSGIQIAKQITPAVAFVSAQIGPGGQGDENFHITASGSMTTKGRSRSDRVETILSETIIATNGESIDTKEDTNLPFFFGEACMMPFETLASYPAKEWSDDAMLILPLPKSLPKQRQSDRFSPFGPSGFSGGFGGFPRPMMPTIPRPYSPFDRGYGRSQPSRVEEKPDTRMALGRRSIHYRIQSVRGDLVTIGREFELKTVDDEDDFASLRIANKGTVVFDRKLGAFVSKKLKGDLRVRLGDENIKIPTTLVYRRGKLDAGDVEHRVAGGANDRAIAAAPIDGIKPVPDAKKTADMGDQIQTFLNMSPANASSQQVLPLINTLATCQVDESQQSKVAERLESYLRRPVPTIPKKPVIDALLNWEPKTATPYVVAEFKAASVFSKRSWLPRLGKTGQSDAAKLLCIELGNSRLRSVATVALKEMGAPAESMVLLRLKNSKDANVTKACLDVLKLVGTGAAIQVIGECGDQPGWSTATATQTINAIQQRGH